MVSVQFTHENLSSMSSSQQEHIWNGGIQRGQRIVYLLCWGFVEQLVWIYQLVLLSLTLKLVCNLFHLIQNIVDLKMQCWAFQVIR